jgi:hypothetical protein
MKMKTTGSAVEPLTLELVPLRPVKAPVAPLHVARALIDALLERLKAS